MTLKEYHSKLILEGFVGKEEETLENQNPKTNALTFVQEQDALKNELKVIPI